jgi:hypothetical protein
MVYNHLLLEEKEQKANNNIKMYYHCSLLIAFLTLDVVLEYI